MVDCAGAFTPPSTVAVDVTTTAPVPAALELLIEAIGVMISVGRMEKICPGTVAVAATCGDEMEEADEPAACIPGADDSDDPADSDDPDAENAEDAEAPGAPGATDDFGEEEAGEDGCDAEEEVGDKADMDAGDDDDDFGRTADGDCDDAIGEETGTGAGGDDDSGAAIDDDELEDDTTLFEQDRS